MKQIHTDKAPEAIGPYSQAIEAGGFIFCSGQIGLDPVSGALKEGIEAQTKQIMENITAVLTEAGSDLSKIVKTTIYITNMADFPTVNKIYGSFFGEYKPARATVGVTSLPASALVEIECVAVK